MSDDYALDFGSARTRVADDQGNLVFDEPTIAAIDDDTGKLLALGDEALRIGAGSAGRVVVVRPVRRGQLMDLALSEEVLGATLQRIGASRLSRPRILVCVHVNETNVQRRALERALKKAGARQVMFIEQPIACAIGAGLAIEEPEGSMAVDVGAGTTDIAVLALGGVVTSASLSIGGDALDEAVRNYISRRHGIVIDWEIAEQVKRAIGTIDIDPGTLAVEVTGRSLSSGSVESAVVSARELAPILEEVVRPIFEAAMRCISMAPPDLANDILGRGLVLGGGGGLLLGFDQRLARATGVAVHVDNLAGALGVTGASQCIKNIDVVSSVSSLSRR